MKSRCLKSQNNNKGSSALLLYYYIPYLNCCACWAWTFLSNIFKSIYLQRTFLSKVIPIIKFPFQWKLEFDILAIIYSFKEYHVTNILPTVDVAILIHNCSIWTTHKTRNFDTSQKMNNITNIKQHYQDSPCHVYWPTEGICHDPWGHLH